MIRIKEHTINKIIIMSVRHAEGPAHVRSVLTAHGLSTKG